LIFCFAYKKAKFRSIGGISIRYIGLCEHVLLVLAFFCVSAVASGSSDSGTYPAEPFNGMQIDYSISGASITKSTDSPGFTTERILEGTLGSGELRVSGTARMGNGYSADLTVKVWAGDKEDTFSANILSGFPGFNEQTFEVAVPVPQGAISGGFSIEMNGHYNAGDRGLIVSGDFASGVSQPPEPPKTQDNIYLVSRTDYILDYFYPNNPGVLTLLSAWQPGTPNDVPVPYKEIYITISEEGNANPYESIVVTTEGNGQVFFKWIFDESEMDKSWIINFSPDSGDPYASGSALTTVSSWIPEDTYSFAPESDFANAYPGSLVQTRNWFYWYP